MLATKKELLALMAWFFKHTSCSLGDLTSLKIRRLFGALTEVKRGELTLPPQSCKSDSERHGAVRYRNLVFHSVTFTLFFVRQAQLRHRQHFGFWATTNQLAANTYSCEKPF